MPENVPIKSHLTKLALRMKQGNRKAAEELYDDLSRKAFGFFYTRTGSREVAEDLSQDIFVRLVKRIESFDEEKGRFEVWFWRIARNMLVDHYRLKKATPFSAFPDQTLEAISVTHEPDIDDRLQYQKVQEYVKKMGEKEYKLFELRYVAQMAYRDMSKLLGRSEGSLRIALMRIREKIRDELTPVLA